MPKQQKRLNDTARGVSAAADSLRVTYQLPAGAKLSGLLVSVRPNAGGPTAAQQGGFARVTVYVGEDQSENVRPITDGAVSLAKGGVHLIDHEVGMVYSNAPQWLPLDFTTQPGEVVTVEVGQYAASDGGVNDAIASVVLQGSEYAGQERIR